VPEPDSKIKHPLKPSSGFDRERSTRPCTAVYYRNAWCHRRSSSSGISSTFRM